MGEFIAQRQLDGGHVAQFPVIGDDIDLFNALEDNADTTDPAFTDAADIASEGGLTAGYHNPGDFITGKKIKMSEKTVRVDDVLVAAIDVPFADLDLTHFDVLTPFSQKLGRSLATDLDRKIAAIALKAATTSAIAGVMPGGQVVEREVTGANNIGSFFADAAGTGNFQKRLLPLWLVSLTKTTCRKKVASCSSLLTSVQSCVTKQTSSIVTSTMDRLQELSTPEPSACLKASS